MTGSDVRSALATRRPRRLPLRRPRRWPGTPKEPPTRAALPEPERVPHSHFYCVRHVLVDQHRDNGRGGQHPLVADHRSSHPHGVKSWRPSVSEPRRDIAPHSSPAASFHPRPWCAPGAPRRDRHRVNPTTSAAPVDEHLAAPGSRDCFPRCRALSRCDRIGDIPHPRLRRAQCCRRPRRPATRASGCRAAESVRERQWRHHCRPRDRDSFCGAAARTGPGASCCSSERHIPLGMAGIPRCDRKFGERPFGWVASAAHGVTW